MSAATPKKTKLLFPNLRQKGKTDMMTEILKKGVVLPAVQPSQETPQSDLVYHIGVDLARDDATPPVGPLVRLWLPGLHTQSLNRTKGRGWIVSYQARKAEAAALLKALQDQPPVGVPASALQGAEKILLLLSAGGTVAARVKELRARLPWALEGQRARLHYTRVACAPLDVENFSGSTKGMTDCLRYAFPLILPDDRPEDVDLVHTQVRCRTRDEEGTWVVLGVAGAERDKG